MEKSNQTTEQKFEAFVMEPLLTDVAKTLWDFLEDPLKFRDEIMTLLSHPITMNHDKS